MVGVELKLLYADLRARKNPEIKNNLQIPVVGK